MSRAAEQQSAGVLERLEYVELIATSTPRAPSFFLSMGADTGAKQLRVTNPHRGITNTICERRNKVLPRWRAPPRRFHKEHRPRHSTGPESAYQKMLQRNTQPNALRLTAPGHPAPRRTV